MILKIVESEAVIWKTAQADDSMRDHQNSDPTEVPSDFIGYRCFIDES